MSRIGKKPVDLPDGVEVKIDGQEVRVKGPKGELQWTVPQSITMEFEERTLVFKRAGDAKTVRALHGLARSLVANMVHGVSSGYEKKLEIHGIGYRANVEGKVLNLALGYSHPVKYPIPEGIEIAVEKNTEISVTGIDKQQVGQVAAQIRAYRPVEPYKGKGIRYQGEYVRRKVGKAGA